MLRKIKINFPPVQPQLKAQPNVYVVPLFTAVNVTFGLQNHSYTEISYTLYMYTDATLKDTDIASSTFDNGIQLLYGAPTGWVVIYPPVGDACYFVCLAVDVSGAFSLTQRNVSLYGQSYPSILSAIVNNHYHSAVKHYDTVECTYSLLPTEQGAHFDLVRLLPGLLAVVDLLLAWQRVFW